MCSTSVRSFTVRQCRSAGKAHERKSASVNTGFGFDLVLMVGLAKRMVCV